MLAIVARQNDVGIFCGRTLAKRGARGDDVTVTYMPRGEYGGFTATEAAVTRTVGNGPGRCFDAYVVFLDSLDGRITSSMENGMQVVEGMRVEARVFGRTNGVEFAEGFERLHVAAVEYLSQGGRVAFGSRWNPAAVGCTILY